MFLFTFHFRSLYPVIPLLIVFKKCFPQNIYIFLNNICILRGCPLCSLLWSYNYTYDIFYILLIKKLYYILHRCHRNKQFFISKMSSSLDPGYKYSKKHFSTTLATLLLELWVSIVAVEWKVTTNTLTVLRLWVFCYCIFKCLFKCTDKNLKKIKYFRLLVIFIYFKRSLIILWHRVRKDTDFRLVGFRKEITFCEIRDGI